MIQHQDSQINPRYEMPPPPVPVSRPDFSSTVESTVARSHIPTRSVTLSESHSGSMAAPLARRDTSVTAPSDISISRSHGLVPITLQAGENLSLPIAPSTVGHTPLVMTSTLSADRTYGNPVTLKAITTSSKTTTALADTPTSSHQDSQSSSITPTPLVISDTASATNQTEKLCSITPVTAHDRSAELLRGLENVPALYELPTKDLEILVAQVVHEDGFVELVRSSAS